MLARFEAEQKALALLEHPSIVKFAEPGLTENGQPFFTMEYVRGTAITTYCDENEADLTSRLALFAEVCAAVEHAHKKSILHRDLKPANILVSVQDGRPVPKIIDWGVAKALNFDLSDRTLFTEQGRWVGTPEYMAPETFAAKEVDPRADVYSLGVLLYELLVGAPPVDGKTLRGKAWDEMARFLREFQPDKPSTRRRTVMTNANATAPRRGLDVHRIPRLQRDEIDEITLKALERKPGDRFQSAAEFANCIQHHLHGKRIFKSPIGPWWARGRRHVQRYRIAYAIAAACMVFLATAYAVAAPRIRRARCNALVESINKRFDAKKDEGAVSRAIDMADSVCTSYPTCSRALSARIYYRLKRLDQCSPTTPIYTIDLQDALAMTDEYFAARMQAEDEWKFWNYKTDLLLRSGRLEEARTSNAEAFRSVPVNEQYRPRVFSTAILAIEGHFAEAITAAQVGIHQIDHSARDGDRDELFRHLAAIQLHLGQLEQAGASLETARSIHKEDHRNDVMLARYLLRKGQEEHLRAHELAAVEGEYQIPYYDRILALARLRIGKYHEAIEAAKRVRAGPDFVPAFRHVIIAIAQAKLGKLADAKAALEAFAMDTAADELKKAKTLVTFNNQFLWIEEYSELEELRGEASALLAVTSPEAPR